MSALRLFDKFQKLLDVTWGSIADGQALKRSGGNIIGYTPTVGGDVTGQASSVDSEVALFSGSGGKTIKRATGTGLVNVTSGVYQTPLVVASVAPPVGSITDFAGSTAPTGWELCYGQSLLRAGTYAALFAVIGTAYGSVDGTHFTLPDCRGRIVAGKDDMGGTAANRLTSTYFANAAVLGATGGGESHVLTTAQLAAHNHTMNNQLVFNSGSGIASGTGYQFTNTLTLDQGLSNAHPNVQPTIVFNKIIKY